MNYWGLTITAGGVATSVASLIWTYVVPRLLPASAASLSKEYRTFKVCLAFTAPILTIVGLFLLADGWGRFIGPLGLGFGILVALMLLLYVLVQHKTEKEPAEMD